MSDLIPMSRTGYNKIKTEVDNLENVEMPKIANNIDPIKASTTATVPAPIPGPIYASEIEGYKKKVNVIM